MESLFAFLSGLATGAYLAGTVVMYLVNRELTDLRSESDRQQNELRNLKLEVRDTLEPSRKFREVHHGKFIR